MDFIGHNAPSRIEAEIFDLVVEGTLPEDLQGSWYQTVPDPQYPPKIPPDTYLSGDCMMRMLRFENGRAVEVKAGTAITWTNGDDIEHTVTSGDPEHRTGRFDQRLSGRGSTTTVKLSEPGIYPYFCDRHPSMRGEVRVNPSETQERSEP